MEHAQVLYLRETGLWEGKNFSEIGMIVAEASCDYKAPAYLGETVTDRARVSHLGTKSLHFEYRLEAERPEGACQIARVTSVQVCYDYVRRESVPMPDLWRKAITAY
jgi:acyl-CoA thioester hydrolase